MFRDDLVQPRPQPAERKSAVDQVALPRHEPRTVGQQSCGGGDVLDPAGSRLRYAILAACPATTRQTAPDCRHSRV